MQASCSRSESQGPLRGLSFGSEAFVVHDDGCARLALALVPRRARGCAGRKQMRRASSRHWFRLGVGVCWMREGVCIVGLGRRTLYDAGCTVSRRTVEVSGESGGWMESTGRTR